MFEKALPVWKMGKEKELNTRCAFFVKFKGIPNAFLRITGCSVYKIYLNVDERELFNIGKFNNLDNH